MIDGIVRSDESSLLGWSELGSATLTFGPKGARLLAVPRPWVPPFVLISYDLAQSIASNTTPADSATEIAAVLEHLSLHTGQLIVRSSVLDETIWERGTFLSTRTKGPIGVADLSSISREIIASAPGRSMALIVQAYQSPDEQGEFGNLMRLSKTRDHWELAVRDADDVTTTERFNSQRSVAPSISEPLEARRGVPRTRLFSEIAAWTNNELLRGYPERVSFEWVRTGTTFYLVQLDREDEDIAGVNPMQVFVEPSVNTGAGGRFLRLAQPDDRRTWDKLAVLDQLYDEQSPLVPSLYLLNPSDCLELNRTDLEQEFEAAFGKNVVIRTSVKAGADKLPNLKKTDCLTPREAADWSIEQASLLEQEFPGIDLAFVAHRYIAARACAWARATPGSPIVEVHGTWGLPDALQFCPYDIWDVHVPTEDITEYPAYKSNVLLLNPDGSWKYERVKNEIARFQSLSRAEIIDVSARTISIANRLGQPCHVMWFVGCKDGDGTEASIPWYWTEAHDIQQPEKRRSRVFDVIDRTTLSKVPEIALRHRDLVIRLIPRSRELLRDNGFLEAVANTVVPLDIPVLLTGSTLAHAFFQLTKHGCTVIPAGEKEHVRPRKQLTFGKLVRDNIPARIAENQEKQRVATIPDDALFGYLIGKLIEEAIEVRGASEAPARMIELADVYEVLRALAALDGKTVADVEGAADRKRAKAGGFAAGHLLLETSIPTSADDDLSVRGATSSSPAIHQLGDNSVSVPFTSFGFMEIGQRVTVRLDQLGLLVQFTMRVDALELTVNSVEEQLALDV